MSRFEWPAYVPVAERRAKAEKVIAKEQKAGKTLAPIPAFRGGIAKTFWGKAWCTNLEQYSDYANRLPRGRTYVRNGSVIDLQIAAGEINAQVMGSSLYKIKVSITALPDAQWQDIRRDCSASISSLIELLQGKLSKAVMEQICQPRTGLFPSPKEIKLSCSCPDGAYMCKHVAAVLYGVGTRLDSEPELLFKLRKVDAKDLVAQTTLPTTATSSSKVLDDFGLADVFGIEMADIAPVTPVKKTPTKRATKPKVVEATTTEQKKTRKKKAD